MAICNHRYFPPQTSRPFISPPFHIFFFLPSCFIFGNRNRLLIYFSLFIGSKQHQSWVFVKKGKGKIRHFPEGGRRRRRRRKREGWGEVEGKSKMTWRVMRRQIEKKKKMKKFEIQLLKLEENHIKENLKPQMKNILPNWQSKHFI